jgi:formylglycine-generating enzyme required for sulfatase activity
MRHVGIARSLQPTTRRAALAGLGHLVGALALAARTFQSSRSDQTGVTAGESRAIDGVALRWCPAGRFTMGSPAAEAGRRADEAQVEVTLTRGFWMAETEVTQAQWQRLHGAPTERPLSERFGLGAAVPIYWVSHGAAEAFCEALTARALASGAIAAPWVFRLPTEAQWEYACRAGTTGPTSFGDDLTLRQANFLGERLDGTVETPAVGKAVPVRSHPANAWGIHEMHGNVFEWCRDWYHARLPGGADPDVQVRGEPNRDGSYSRVRRGGAWNDGARFCRSAVRFRYEPHRSSDHIGFRVALVRA